MRKKLNPIKVRQELMKRQISIFSPLDFRRIFDVAGNTASFFINYHLKTGFFVKLRSGLYMLADYPANRYLIANRLYQPSYISFDAALSFYGIIPETVYAITSATTKTTREFKVGDLRFVYHKIKKPAYRGYKSVKYLDNTILIAEPEKALADYLYFVALGKRGLHYERIDLKKINKAGLLEQAKLFKSPKIIKLIKEIYVELGKPKRVY